MRKVIVLACLAAVTAAVSAPGAFGAASLPFKGTLSGSGTLDLVAFQLHAVVSGELTHFGRATLVENIQVSPGPGGTLLWNGDWSLTAANGDAMSGTSAGVGHFTDATLAASVWSVEFVAHDGTGRFAGARLQFHADAVATTTGVTPTVISADVFAPVTGRFEH